MAEVRSLQTKIALLYRNYSEWATTQKDYVGLKGEVMFAFIDGTENPKVFANEPCVAFKVGNGSFNDEGEVVGTTFENLPWAYAQAADVNTWAKKENLEFTDLTADFKTAVLNYVKDNIGPSIIYKLALAEGSTDKWNLMQSTDAGQTWTVVTGSAELDFSEAMSRISNLESRMDDVETALDEIKALSDAEINEVINS